MLDARLIKVRPDGDDYRRPPIGGLSQGCDEALPLVFGYVTGEQFLELIDQQYGRVPFRRDCLDPFIQRCNRIRSRFQVDRAPPVALKLRQRTSAQKRCLAGP